MAGKNTEQVINVELAKVLRGKHPRWKDRIDVEQTNVLSEGRGLQPDILVRHPNGLPVIIETEVEPAATVEADAKKRLGKTLDQDGAEVEQTIALRIPKDLSNAPQHELATLIQNTVMEFCVLSGSQTQPRWPETGWIKGGINELAACIEQASLSETRLAKGMSALEEGVKQAANRLREAGEAAPDMLDKIAEHLHQEDCEQTSRMAMAIVANAMTFHTSIAGAHGIETLDQLRVNGRISKTRTLDVWRRILDEINYWPIFRIASDILLPIKNGTAEQILDRLAMVAKELGALGATSHHDLCGRMFQRLISDRKFLATFYTLPSSAALLAELAVSRMDVDWSDREAVTSLKIGDFACGTGALLNAAYGAVLSRYRWKGRDDQAIHPRMMESALVGTDIMPAATHLTASVLSSNQPSVPFEDTSIVCLPYGEGESRDMEAKINLGALDLITEETMEPLFDTGRQRMKGVEKGGTTELGVPGSSFDLVIMNPPFTRPTNHKISGVPVPSFAGFATSKDEQKAMSRKLKKIRTPDMAGHGNAGLASNFLDIAHAKVKNGGVVALVLPASFLQGESWTNARHLLREHYRDILIVSITAVGATDYAFSADTGMGEVLVVATRSAVGAGRKDLVRFVNLTHRPETILEAVGMAWATMRVQDIRDTGRILTGTEEIGTLIQGTLSHPGDAGVREPGVVGTAAALARGRLKLPRGHREVDLPVTTLGDLGTRGLVHRDINGDEEGRDGLPRGPFDITDLTGSVPEYPALWGHDAKRETRMSVRPDSKGEVRPSCDERAAETWKATASRLHFNLDFRLNSQPLAACLTPEPTLGGRAWPNFLCHQQSWEPALALWTNTTLGLIAFWWIGARQHMGRALLTISKLPDLTVLDARKFSSKQLAQADAIFQEFKDHELLPANEAWSDVIRHKLDRRVLIDLLGLPEDITESLELLRKQWCAEPSVHGGKNTAPGII